MKRYCLIMLLSSFVLVSGAAVWEIKPWQAYLIEQRIKTDTLKAQVSIMLPQRLGKKNLAKPNFNIPHYYPLPQKTMFERWDEQERNARIARGDYHTGDFVVDMLCDILTIFSSK